MKSNYVHLLKYCPYCHLFSIFCFKLLLHYYMCDIHVCMDSLMDGRRGWWISYDGACFLRLPGQGRVNI